MGRDSRQREGGLEFPRKRNRSLLPIFFLGLALLAAGTLAMRVQLSVTGQGVIEAREYSRLYAGRQGSVARLLAEVGDRVEHGQPLVLLAPPAREREAMREIEAEIGIYRLQRSLLEVQAEEQAIALLDPEIASAPARAEALRDIMELETRIESSLQSLSKSQFLSSTEYMRQRIQSLRTLVETLEEEAKASRAKSGLAELVGQSYEARIEIAEAEMRKREAALAQIREETLLRSPATGRIGRLSISYVGEAVAEGQLVAEVVGEENAYQARVWVSQQNIDLIRPGSEAQMASHVFNSRLEGYIHGVVERISPLPEAPESGTEASGPTYELVIKVKRAPYPLAYGSTVEAEVFFGKGTLWEALTGRPSELRQTERWKR